jgi:hypothetical protein
MVIAAVCHPLATQAGEQAVIGSVIVEVKGLRIELACKRLDLCRVHDVCFAGEALPHLEVIEIERIVATYLTRYRHDPPLQST